MANISFFYPDREKGYALGLNAAGGNIGVSTVQLLVPAQSLAAVDAQPRHPSRAGHVYLENAGLMWLPLIAIAVVGRVLLHEQPHVGALELQGSARRSSCTSTRGSCRGSTSGRSDRSSATRRRSRCSSRRSSPRSRRTSPSSARSSARSRGRSAASWPTASAARASRSGTSSLMARRHDRRHPLRPRATRSRGSSRCSSCSSSRRAWATARPSA